MKLLSCEIANFGVLCHETREFSDGLNTVYAPNGEGKSTLAVFIKAMLYGLPQSTKRKLNDNERKRYQPWQGGDFGGSLCFEANGKRYRVERFFGAKESEDTFALTDLSTNLPSTDFSANLGYELFGLGADAYERSTYISQRILPDKPEGDDLKVKLTHLIEESGDLSTLEDALRILDKRRSEYQLRGGRGRIEEGEKQIAECEQEIAVLERRLAAVAEARAKLRGEKEDLKTLQADRDRYDETVKKVSELGKKKEVLARWRELEDDRTELQKKHEALQSFFGGAIPTREELAAKKKETEQLVRLSAQAQAARLSPTEEERLARLTACFPDGCPTEEKLADARSAVSRIAETERENDRLRAQADSARHLAQIRREQADRDRTRRRKTALGVLSVGGAMLIGAVVLFVLSKLIPAILLTVCGLVAIVGDILLSRRVRPAQDEPDPAAEYEAQIAENERLCRELARSLDTLFAASGDLPGTADGLSSTSGSVSAALDRLSADAREYRSLSERREECEKRRAELEAQYDALADSVKAYLSCWYDPDSAGAEIQLAELETKVARFAELAEAIHAAEEKAETYRREHDLSPTDSDGTSPETSDGEDLPDEATLEAERLRINRETDRTKDEIARLERYLADCGDVEEELAAARERHDALCEQRERDVRSLGIIQTTAKYLSDARSRLSSRYLDTMQNGFRRYFSALTGEGAESYEMDTDFDVKFRRDGKSYSAEYLSRGLRDAISLCTRFALADALFEGEKPFLILDDPLVNLDDEKLKNAARLLSAAGERYQILHLVCSRSRM